MSSSLETQGPDRRSQKRVSEAASEDSPSHLRTAAFPSSRQSPEAQTASDLPCLRYSRNQKVLGCLDSCVACEDSAPKSAKQLRWRRASGGTAHRRWRRFLSFVWRKALQRLKLHIWFCAQRITRLRCTESRSLASAGRRRSACCLRRSAAAAWPRGGRWSGRSSRDMHFYNELAFSRHLNISARSDSFFLLSEARALLRGRRS